jgi:3-deoxy-D-manno-octulosonic-acid transferase
MHSALANVTWLAAKSSEDAARFQALGCAADATTVVGSLKFEQALPDKALAESERLLQAWGERPVWVAGSTRDGEEALLLTAHRQLLKRFPDALLVLVPRHPQRFDEVAALCEREGWKVSRHSQQQPVTPATQIYLGDTLGELAALYGAGSVAYVGGSLVPLGGHNVLEPAALGKPVLCGPSLENFSDVAEPLLAAKALTVVDTPKALASTLAEYIAYPQRARQAGEAGQAAIEAHRGALSRTLDGLGRYL